MIKKEPPLEKVGRTKGRRFEDVEVYELRRRVKDGERITALAREFRVSRPCIAAAIYGEGAYEGVGVDDEEAGASCS